MQIAVQLLRRWCTTTPHVWSREGQALLREGSVVQCHRRVFERKSRRSKRRASYTCGVLEVAVFRPKTLPLRVTNFRFPTSCCCGRSFYFVFLCILLLLYARFTPPSSPTVTFMVLASASRFFGNLIL